MKTYDVRFDPVPGTRAERVEVAADAPLREGYQRMTEAEYQAWVAAQPPPAEPTPEVPHSVTPWQMRRALNQLGLRATVEAAVAGADQDTKDGWEFALEIRRDNPLIAGMAAGLGLTSGQIDDLFRLAATFQ
jgi:hypothetical protein